MKKEILTLIIGILIGAIIATGVFLVLKNDTSSTGGEFSRDDMSEMERPSDMDEGDYSVRGGNKMNTNTTEDTTSDDEI